MPWFLWAALLLLPTLQRLLMRRLPGKGPEPAAPTVALDLPLALLLGVATAAISYALLAPIYLEGREITEDFLEYCAVVRWARDGAPAAVEPLLMRQVAMGLPTALVASQVGLIESMRLTSLACAAALGAVLYLWGLVLADRTAGVVACLLTLTMGPVVLMTRHLTFYPMFTLLTALCGLLASVALRWPRPLTLAAGSVGVGLLLLADQIGLVWAPFFFVALLAAAWRSRGVAAEQAPTPPRRRWAKVARMAGALLLPLVISWVVAGALPAPNLHSAPGDGDTVPRASLEQRVAYHLQAHLHKDVPDQGGGVMWGHGGLSSWLGSAMNLPGLMAMAGQSPNFNKVAGHPERDISRRQLLPWQLAGAAALILAMVLLRRRWRWLQLLLVLLPFVLYLLLLRTLTLEHSGQVEHDLGHPIVQLKDQGYYFIRAKFLILGLPAVALVLGLAWALLAGTGSGDTGQQPGRGSWWRAALAGLLAAALVVALVPRAGHPGATWKLRYRGSDYPARLQQRARDDKLEHSIGGEKYELFKYCAQGVQQDL